MKIIGCGIVSLNLIFVAATPFCNSISYLFAMLMTKEGKIFKSLSQAFFVYLCKIFGGLGWIYSYYSNQRTFGIHRAKTRKNMTIMQFKTIKPIHSQGYAPIFFLLFFISFMMVIQNIIQTYMTFKYEILDDESKSSNLKFELFAIHIFYISILSYFILNYSLYRHQIVSLGIIIVGILLIYFPNITLESNLEIRLPMYCLEYFLSSLRYVLEKWLMEKKNLSVYQLLLFEGLIGAVLCIISGFVIELFPSEWKTMLGTSKQIFEDIISGITAQPLYLTLEFVFCLLYNLCAMLLKYYYTPMHCSVTNLVTSLLMWVMLISQNRLLNNNICQVGVGYLFLTIGQLIYIEIFICYFCGLHENTKKEISKRSEVDFNPELILTNTENTIERNQILV